MRAVIFANGILNRPTASTQFDDDDLIIAADGGANHCLTLGITPDILIGDMDSVEPDLINDLRSKGTQLVLFPRDKDQIDLELALSYAVDQGVKEVILLGLLGGRLDLSLANLLLLARDDWKATKLVVSDGPDQAYLIHENSHLSLIGKPGDIISLIPLTPQVLNVSSKGLRWPLRSANLEFGSTLSISNELNEDSAEIQIGAGKLLLVHRSDTDIVGKE